jgi:hypothetical protein
MRRLSMALFIALSVFVVQLTACNSTSTATDTENKTPKPNAEAEQLSLEATGALIAPQPVYERVVNELNVIRTTYPPFADIAAIPSWSLQNLILGFDDAGRVAVQEGIYTAWDVLNNSYGVTQISLLGSAGAVAITFAGRYNMPLLAGEYAKLSHVQYAEPDYIVGDGNDVCLSIDGETHFFIFDAGSGDCPAGCIQHTYWAFAATVDSGITVLGTWDNSSGNAQPPWLLDLPACRAWL